MLNRSKKIRTAIILVLLILLMAVLLFKLYSLTIKEGDYYRNLSENKRTKEIQIAAPRGNIYDVNGELLAGTRISYSVQSYKDDFKTLNNGQKDKTLADLVRYMDYDGVDYLEDFPISIDIFRYTSKEEYFKEILTPQSKAEKLLSDNNLLSAWLNSIYEGKGEGDYRVSMAARALKAFSLKGLELPLKVDFSNNFVLSYNEKSPAYKKMIDEKILDISTTPINFLANQVKNNPSILSQIMNHPAAKKIAYDILKSKNLQGNLLLDSFVYTYEENLMKKKGLLHQRYPEIKETSSAQEDFVCMVKSVGLDKFLESMSVGKDNRFYIPAENLINKLNSLETNLNLTYRINSDAKSVSIDYEKDGNLEEKPIDRLKKLAEKHRLLEDVIVADEYKDLAQQALFSQGIYPGININKWIYTLEKDQEDFLKRYKLKNESAEEALDKILEKRKIKEVDDPIWTYGKLVSQDKIMYKASNSYAPLNLCYELSKEIVSKIEENIPSHTGIIVSRESIRFYPHGEAACHVLGYIGKIASEEEVKKYIKEKGYLPGELIGKTGVEESFEDTLRGVPGKELVRIDSKGNRTETLNRTEPKAGNNLHLTIDIKYQMASEKLIKNAIKAVKKGINYISPWGSSSTLWSPSICSGSSVSADPRTGEIRAMVSYPGYDPNLFVTGISNNDWEVLRGDNNPDKDKPLPLLNLITQSAVQPGSSLKPVVALSALEHGLNPKSSVNCTGSIMVGDTRFKCWVYPAGHGYQDLYEAIRHSCNSYFYKIGLGMDSRSASEEAGFKLEVDQLAETAKKMGMDKHSGIEINTPAESKNNIPTQEGKTKLSLILLEKYLKSELSKYIKAGISKSSKDIEEDIKTIIAWSKDSSKQNRNKLIKNLEILGYEPLIPLQAGKVGLVDNLKYSYFNQIGWTKADSCNTMIGQGQNSYTPITMLGVAVSIANRGEKMQFSLVKEIRAADNETLIYKQVPKSSHIDIKRKNFDIVVEGMKRAAYDKKGINTLPFASALKTGTATRDDNDPRTGKHYSPHIWVMGFAPLENPKIANIIYMPLGRLSSNLIPVLRDLYSEYFNIEATNSSYRDSYYDGIETYKPLTTKELERIQGNTNKNNTSQENQTVGE